MFIYLYFVLIICSNKLRVRTNLTEPNFCYVRYFTCVALLNLFLMCVSFRGVI